MKEITRTPVLQAACPPSTAGVSTAHPSENSKAASDWLSTFPVRVEEGAESIEVLLIQQEGRYRSKLPCIPCKGGHIRKARRLCGDPEKQGSATVALGAGRHMSTEYTTTVGTTGTGSNTDVD